MRRMPDGLIEESGLLYVGVTARSKGGICLRLDATQDKIGRLSGHLSLLSNVYSGYCACELGGDGYGELTSSATRRVCYGRESRSVFHIGSKK